MFDLANQLAAFRPLPLLGNPHLQTLLAHFLPGRACPPPDRRYVVNLADGDAILLHENLPPRWRPGEPMVLLVHGLSGTHASGHVTRITGRLLRAGLRTVRIDLRGTGQGLPLARQTYHAGRSEDLRAALAEMHTWAPTSPLWLVGVSLGGAIALRLAGEAAERPVPGLEQVVSLAPPIDLNRCAALLAHPRNRRYEETFLRDLIRDARRRQRHFPDLPVVRFPRRMTMRLFDDLYTAPLNGFADALDYYNRASALPFVERIDLPTLVLTARDDPFIAAEAFEELQVADKVRVQIVPHGGHLGFLGWDGAGGIRWAERWMVEWLLHTR